MPRAKKKGPHSFTLSDLSPRKRKQVEKLYEENIPLARYIVKKISQRMNIDYQLLESEGMYALLRASKGFRPSLGYAFSTYASRAIHNATMTVAKRELRYQGHAQLTDATPTPRRQSLFDKVADAEELEQQMAWLNKFLSTLSDRDRRIMAMRFNEGCTFRDIAEATGLSRERVRQIVDRTIDRIRRSWSRSLTEKQLRA